MAFSSKILCSAQDKYRGLKICDKMGNWDRFNDVELRVNARLISATVKCPSRFKSNLSNVLPIFPLTVCFLCFFIARLNVDLRMFGSMELHLFFKIAFDKGKYLNFCSSFCLHYK